MQEKQYVHTARLASDYRSLEALVGSIISWKPDTPCDPDTGKYPDKYLVTFNILAPTVDGDRHQHDLGIDCSSVDYPARSIPSLRFRTSRIRHPHVYNDGRVCLGGFPLGESLAELCVRMARFIQFDPALINPSSIASHEANDWYHQNFKRFPMDRSPIPSVGQDNPFRSKRIREGNQTEGQISVIKRRSPGTSQ